MYSNRVKTNRKKEKKMARPKKSELKAVQAVTEVAPVAKSHRSEAEINNEYAAVCTQLGDRFIKKSALEEEMENLKKRVIELGLEMSASRAAAAEVKSE